MCASVKVVKLKGYSSNSNVKGWSHYFTIISRIVTSDGQDCVDSVILGIDIKHHSDDDDDTAAEAGDDADDINDDDDELDCEDGVSDEDLCATVGLVLPVTCSMSVSVVGQGFVAHTVRLISSVTK